jgi:hypothetical protein
MATQRSSRTSRSQAIPTPATSDAPAWPSSIGGSPRVIARSCGTCSCLRVPDRSPPYKIVNVGSSLCGLTPSRVRVRIVPALVSRER